MGRGRTSHRGGAVETWSRSTNRKIKACEPWGVEPPIFEERTGTLVVTFRAPIALGADARHQAGTKLALSEHQVQVLDAARTSQPISSLLDLCGRSDRTKFRDQVLRPLLDAGLLEMTIPDKPRSPKQRYRTTAAGRQVLEEQERK